MGVSRQASFTLACATLLAVVVPGCAGYLSARMEAVEKAYRNLASLEDRMREPALDGQTRRIVAPFPVPCGLPARPRSAPEKPGGSEKPEEPKEPAESSVSASGPGTVRERTDRVVDRDRRHKGREEPGEVISPLRETVQGTIIERWYRPEGPEPAERPGGPVPRPLAENPAVSPPAGNPLG
ncbi:hypothetical protein GCM10010156_21910 [Planobispora rosea]|uniref:Uncharacterized protein n=1 Tax=Planobispora rosea TaxID=35762 RepID=A0A8J3RWB3_PLARO|nr:hypothetical protein [Planobispora rosea]GGS62578.1 hypothetical protein GCM10010156_21910 [Planobispora rosea]GIH84296.1 hypothetical protein Pro02_27040 [Planobispora rosea]